MSESKQPVAIIKHVATVSITFVEKPSDEQRRELKGNGFRYENGNWFKSQTQGQHGDADLVAKVIEA